MTNEARRLWRIIFQRQPEKMMRRLPKEIRPRLDRAILALTENPRPPGCVKLISNEDLYRIRVGDWRVIYAIEDDELIILVVEIAPRGEAYRDL